MAFNSFRTREKYNKKKFDSHEDFTYIVDSAGYRTLSDQIQSAMLTGSMAMEARAMADYDSDYFDNEDDMIEHIEARQFNRMSEFDDIHSFVQTMQSVEDRIQRAHEAVGRAHLDRLNKFYEERNQEEKEQKQTKKKEARTGDELPPPVS